MSGLRERADASAQVLVADLDAPALDDADDHHLRRVLRLRHGATVVASDGAGGWRRCVIAAGGLEPAGDVAREAPAARPIGVWLPALKGDRAEWAVQKLTELGVDEIGLLRCARALARDDDATARVLARWRRVAKEATCQSRRTWLPRVLGPCTVRDAVAAGAWRCDVEGAVVTPSATALAVGPEGGWSDDERPGRDEAVGLADAVLRTETAAVAAGTLLALARRRHGAAVEAP